MIKISVSDNLSSRHNQGFKSSKNINSRNSINDFNI